MAVHRAFDKFHDAGFDQIQVLCDRCHQKNMQFLVCLRMNDRHGIARHEKFYLEHPEWRLNGAPSPGGMDYKYDGVRAPVLEFVEEDFNDMTSTGLSWTTCAGVTSLNRRKRSLARRC